jgi:hypothetical protein
VCIEPLHWAADLGLLSGALRPWQSLARPARGGPGVTVPLAPASACWHWHDCQAARAGNAPHDDARPSRLRGGGAWRRSTSDGDVPRAPFKGPGPPLRRRRCCQAALLPRIRVRNQDRGYSEPPDVKFPTSLVQVRF